MSRRIVRSFSAIFGSQLGVLVLTVATTPLLTRLLGSGGYGDYSFVLSALQWLLVFVYAGAFNGIRKYIAEDRNADGWTDHVFAFYFRMVAVLAAGMVVLVLLLSRSPFVSPLGSEFTGYFLLLACIIPLRAAFRIARSGLMGLELESYSEPLQIVDRLFFVVVIAILSVVGGGVAAVLLGRLLGIAIAAGVALALVSQRIDLSKIGRRTPETVPRKRLATYSVSTMTLAFLLLSLYHLDIILLRFLAGDSATGFYRAALVVAEFLWFVPTAVQLTLLHSTSNLWIEERYDRLSEIGSRAVRYTLLCTLLLVLGVAGLAEPFLTFYFGPEFDAAVVPLLLLLPGALGFAVARPVFAINQGQDNLRLLVVVTAVAATMNVALNVALIPRFGTSGAAIATSISYGSMFGLHVWTARRLGFDPLVDIRIVRTVATAVLAAVPIIGLPYVLQSGVLSLALVPPIGALAFASAALATGAVRRDEVQQLAALSPLPAETLVSLLPDRVAESLRSTDRDG
ncbi:oligosaccharide flippase family protein [Natrialba aegyptia]|uniref:Polysaccharide biosynthesis protein n=1 Tax=Natrialba aegyptia DSM 13077 TaxID=1227491 RepID=M0AFW9_9EURY|nr:polysaccharide biosynthesis C-terminal domain-containing protein [Natrialba aegyptia]ELY97625.1 polysaccharide biosynthesis protein [Natrialba aegyptia DSM 13077]